MRNRFAKASGGYSSSTDMTDLGSDAGRVCMYATVFAWGEFVVPGRIIIGWCYRKGACHDSGRAWIASPRSGGGVNRVIFL